MRERPARFVYFVRATNGEGPIKIGCSLAPLQRLEGLMGWSPVDLEILATIPGNEVLERRFHHQFRAHHKRHEWFHPTDEMMNVIARIAAGDFDVNELPEPRSLYSGRPRKVCKVRQAELHAERAIHRLSAAGVTIPDELHYASLRLLCPTARLVRMQAFASQYPASMTTAEGVRKAAQDKIRAARPSVPGHGRAAA